MSHSEDNQVLQAGGRARRLPRKQKEQRELSRGDALRGPGFSEGLCLAAAQWVPAQWVPGSDKEEALRGWWGLKQPPSQAASCWRRRAEG